MHVYQFEGRSDHWPRLASVIFAGFEKLETQFTMFTARQMKLIDIACYGASVLNKYINDKYVLNKETPFLIQFKKHLSKAVLQIYNWNPLLNIFEGFREMTSFPAIFHHSEPQVQNTIIAKQSVAKYLLKLASRKNEEPEFFSKKVLRKTHQFFAEINPIPLIFYSLKMVFIESVLEKKLWTWFWITFSFPLSFFCAKG